MPELKYIHYRDNIFNSSSSLYNRHSSNYYNIYHYHQQSQLKRLSNHIRQKRTSICQWQQQLLRYSQENNINNLSDRVKDY